MGTDLHDTLAFANCHLERALRLGRVEFKDKSKRSMAGRNPTKPSATDKGYRKMQPDERKEIVAMWNAGKTVGEIRKKNYREWAHIRYVLTSEGIDPNSRRKTSTCKERITKLLLSGLSVHQVDEHKISALTYVRAIERDLIAEGKITRK